MSAPYKIWADGDASCKYDSIEWDWSGGCWGHDPEREGEIEYVRADLVPQWMPIETAPKDGTVILIYEPPYLSDGVGTIYTASWDCDYYNTWIEAGGERYMSFDNPTHWMPLPNPPPAT